MGRALRFGDVVCVAIVVVLMLASGLPAVLAQGPGQQDATPAPGSSSAGEPGATASLEALSAAALQENLGWENITFWGDRALGDDSMTGLMISYGIGQPFPDLTMTLMDGSSFSLSSIEGPVLLNVWASWCTPCRQELPYLLEADADPAAPFRVVLLNAWDSTTSYRSFAEAELPETLISGTGADAFVAQAGVQAIPVSVLLGGAHQVVAVHVGNLTPAAIDLLYALATTPVLPPAAPDLSQTVGNTGSGVDASLAQMAVELGRVDREQGSATLWAGGTVGVQEGNTSAVRIGDKLPAFGLMTNHGDLFVSDMIEGPYLLNFWASWCGPCVTEFPLLIDADHDPDSAFRVAFINIWDDRYTFEEFLADYPPDILAMTDETGTIPDSYRFDFIPISILIDESGIVRLIQMGPANSAVLDFADALLRARLDDPAAW